jgi:cobalt-zinc-cadmium resistance protein CzcA
MDRLVALAVSRRYLMVAMFVAVFIGGLIAFGQLNIEAYPDPTPPMVDIVTQSPGLSSEEIERYITIPIETQVAGIKNCAPSAPSRCTDCPTSNCSSPSITPMKRRCSRC